MAGRQNFDSGDERGLTLGHKRLRPSPAPPWHPTLPDGEVRRESAQCYGLEYLIECIDSLSGDPEDLRDRFSLGQIKLADVA